MQQRMALVIATYSPGQLFTTFVVIVGLYHLHIPMRCLVLVLVLMLVQMLVRVRRVLTLDEKGHEEEAAQPTSIHNECPPDVIEV